MKFFNQMIITGMLTKIAVTDWKEQKIFNQDVTILFCYCLMQLFFAWIKVNGEDFFFM